MGDRLGILGAVNFLLFFNSAGFLQCAAGVLEAGQGRREHAQVRLSPARSESNGTLEPGAMTMAGNHVRPATTTDPGLLENSAAPAMSPAPCLRPESRQSVAISQRHWLSLLGLLAKIKV